LVLIAFPKKFAATFCFALARTDFSSTRSLPAQTADAYALETSMGSIVRAFKTRYANVQLVFVSSRIYAGWATTVLT